MVGPVAEATGLFLGGWFLESKIQRLRVPRHKALEGATLGHGSGSNPRAMRFLSRRISEFGEPAGENVDVRALR